MSVTVLFQASEDAEFVAAALRAHAGHVDDAEDAADLRDLADRLDEATS